MNGGGVRELQRSDLPRVAAMFEEYTNGGAGPPAPIPDHFARLLFDHPGPHLPSMVYEDATGKVVGYCGTRALWVRLDGRRYLMSSPVGLLVAPAARGQGAATGLLARVLGGPQDLTVIDDAAEVTRRYMMRLGAHVCPTASIAWRRVLRPGAAATTSHWWGRRPRPVRHAVARSASRVDRVAMAVPALRERFVPVSTADRSETLTPEFLCALIADSGPGLRPDHDPAYLEWVFGELDAADRPSRVVRRLVRGADRSVLGWYVMHVGTAGVAQVLGLGASAPDPGPVLDHLLLSAFDLGAAAVEGRLEPSLLPALRARRCLMQPSIWTLVHSRDPALCDAVTSPFARLQRLDGNWWDGAVLWRTPDEQRRRRSDGEPRPAPPPTTSVRSPTRSAP